MKRLLTALLALALLLPAVGHAAPQPYPWQVYTVGTGLIERDSYVAAPDLRGGLWVGHVSGGRAINRTGGLSHILGDGNFRRYRTQEPFISCSSVDALAPTSDGWVWLWLSGYHDYGINDYTQTCRNTYGVSGGLGSASTVALGVISPDGTPQMLPKEQIPTDLTWGMVTDARGRVWVGTKRGLSMREADGSWRQLGIWLDAADSTSAMRVAPDGSKIALGSSTGAVAVVQIVDAQSQQVTLLPRPSDGRPRPVADLTFMTEPEGVVAVIWDTVYLYTPQSSMWATLPLPSNDSYGQHLAYTAGRVWASSPVAGLRYLDQSGWKAFPTERLPLGRITINDLRAVDNQLFLATDQGALRLDPSLPLPDPSGAQAAFDALWQRTNTSTGSSWVWGPQVRDQRFEPFREGPGGARYVRYYDKARMELNDPSGDPNSPWFVTNGLLVVEMVRGKVQLGLDPERGTCPVAPRSDCASFQQVAGDLSFDANQLVPRYSDFTGRLATAPPQVGQTVATTLTRQGVGDPLVEGQERGLASAPTTIAVYDRITGHNIPRLFWDFMQHQPVDALFAFGRPIAEPYWVRTELGGKAQWVMVQLFERRVLTYTPGNAPAWQVEMGNVGQHYFLWRYPGG